jgi:hypothetical protein
MRPFGIHHLVAIVGSFFSSLKKHFIAHIWHNFIILLSLGGHLGGFCILAIVDNAVCTWACRHLQQILVSSPSGMYSEKGWWIT